MKRLLAACAVVSSLLASGVWAAEAPGADAFDWSGFYVGAHGGFSWGHSSSSTVNTATGASEGSGSSNSSAGSGGIQFGDDYLLTKNILVGLDFRASAVDSSSDETFSNAAGTNVHTNHARTPWAESLTGRLGYAYRNWLLYGRGGVVFDQGHVTRTQVVGTTGLATPGTVEKESNDRVGWTVGSGVEFGFARGWSAFVEYRYSETSHTTDFPMAQRSSDTHGHSNAIQFGLNYKFNWGSPLFGQR
jgi:opacity protein-like surface antigen